MKRGGRLPPGDIYYVIRSVSRPFFVRDNRDGWTADQTRAVRYTHAEHLVTPLPLDAVWSFRRDEAALLDRGFVKKVNLPRAERRRRTAEAA